MIARLPAILLGYFAACLAAGAVLITASLLEWRNQVGEITSDLAVLSLYGGLIYVGALILPALAAAAITEWLRIRRLTVYLSLRILCLFLTALHVGVITFRLPILVRDVSVTAIIAGAGVVAGLAYWFIAGRNAGT